MMADGGYKPEDIYFIAVPMPTVRALSDVAAKLNLGFAQLLAKALDEFLEKHKDKPQDYTRAKTPQE